MTDRIKDKPVGILGFGVGLGGLVAVLTLLLLDREQCPSGFTQEQVDASNCIIGANIGLGLGLMFAVAIVVAAAALALVAAIHSRRSKN